MSSTTANITRAALVSAFLTASITFAVAPAAAAPGACATPSPELTKFCKGIGDMEDLGTPGGGPTLVPTTAPSTSSSSGGLSGFVSEHAGLIVLVVAGLIAWAVIAGFRGSAADKATEAAAEQQAELDRGRLIAQDHHAAQVQAAHDAVALLRPDPSVYDPDGIGLAPPPMPAPVLPDPPPQSDDDLRRYGAFGTVVPWQPGTAFAQVVTRSGGVSRAEQAWTEASRLARLGETDPESGVFTPAATLVQVCNVPESGDVLLVVEPASYLTGEQQLNRAIDFLVRTARVRSAAQFAREPSTDRFVTRLSNDVAQQSAPAPQQQVARAQQAAAYNDDDDWI